MVVFAWEDGWVLEDGGRMEDGEGLAKGEVRSEESEIGLTGGELAVDGFCTGREV